MEPEPSPSAKAETRQCNSLGASPPTPLTLRQPQSAAPSERRPFPSHLGFLSLMANPSPQEQGPSWHESLGHLFIHDTYLSMAIIFP